MAKTKKMTFEQFLKRLRRLRGQFVNDHGLLRMVDTIVGYGPKTEVCPLSAVGNLLGDKIWACHISSPAMALNLSNRMALRIADAADSRSNRGIRRNYRARMLRALRLKETAQD